jgi:hypothetical protein
MVFEQQSMGRRFGTGPLQAKEMPLPLVIFDFYWSAFVGIVEIYLAKIVLGATKPV